MQRRSTELPFSINGYTFLVSLAFFFSLSFSHRGPNNNNDYNNTTTGNDDDFSVLLAFKSSSDTSNSLVSWTSAGGSDPCSSWLGVTCHPITHRVTKLVLNYLNLTGSIQTLALLRQLRHLSLHHNHLSSTLAFTSWPDLRHLYLSHNHFTGRFPSGVSHLRGLRRLDLSYNGFFGEIPLSELTQLSHLLTLRLEFNSFNGTLSSVVSSSSSSSTLTSSLSDFNVSENGLAGRIPDWLSNFQASAFAGNRHLCGKPLLTDCPVKPVMVNPSAGRGPLPIGVTDIKKKKKSSRTDMILMIILIDAAALLLIILTIGFCCYYKKKYTRDKKTTKNPAAKRFVNSSTTMDDASGELVFFEGCKGFSKVDELLKASAEMLGKGTVGTTYRVVMDGGNGDSVVVVKRIREKVKRAKEIGGCLREIGGLRHPNVVSLRAYYSSKEELLLVYDFLQNGSLHNLLHGNRGPGRTPLDWPTRLRFALGSAEGLAFIHGYTKSKHLLHLHHGHLTSSNILIDNNGNACIADVGLYQLLQLTLPLSSNNNNNNAYKAPELLLLINNNNNNNNNGNIGNGAIRKLTAMQKCDVYSFGVILLELLTGKMASQVEIMRLGKWVGGGGRGGGGEENGEWKWDVFDFELVRHKEMEEEMIALLKVAMLCLGSSSKDRPKMSAVHKMIEDISTNINVNGASKTKTTAAPAPAMDEQSSHSSNSV